MKQEDIMKLEAAIAADYSNIAGMVVRKDGETVYERYFGGCTAESRLNVFSVTKSIVSILLGIALDRGCLGSIDQQVLEFFPEYTPKRGEKTIQRITIRDMLTMTAPYKYRSTPYTKYFTSPDWVRFSLDLLGGKGPVGEFRYAPLIGLDILTGILTRVTGQSVLDFAKERLFAPLGIPVEQSITFRSKEELMAFYKSTDLRVWAADPAGVNAGGWGLTLSPMDLAKLGQLYLDGGIWTGQRLVYERCPVRQQLPVGRRDEICLSERPALLRHAALDGASLGRKADALQQRNANPAWQRRQPHRGLFSLRDRPDRLAAGAGQVKTYEDLRIVDLLPDGIRYDLNNGETDDKIAYAFSDATIIAAQSMYAEKFIAPAGSDSWSKQGLLVKAGSDFDYLLEIVNETAAVHTGLTVYDTLPRIGDPNLFGASGRGSEFPVRLRSAITPPEGYTIYYTTSPEVYPHSMEEMVDSDIWTTSVTDYASVTAFKLVAGEGTELAGNSRFQVRIPVCAPKTFDEDSMALLRAKVDQDQASGTVSWLQAVNAFGFRTVQTPTVKESNTVWARVCFAGFCVKKVNGATQAALPGAEFTLTDAAGTIVGTAVSDADGRLQFRELTEGAYVLPKTGGRGTAAFYVPGAFLLLSAALPDLRKRRSRKR